MAKPNFKGALAAETSDGQAARNFAAAQRRRWDEINDFLQAHGLSGLPGRFGRWQDGEPEILRLSGGMYVTLYQAFVGFDVRFPDGIIREYTMRFHTESATKRAVLAIPIINGQLAFIGQFRPVMGTWYLELPRQFARSSGQTTIVDRKLREAAQALPAGVDVPLGLLGRELTPVLIKRDFEVEKVTLLDNGMAQDTGADTTLIQVWLMRLRTPDTKNKNMKLPSGSTLRYHTLDEVMQSGRDGRKTLRELGISDALTRGALDILRETLG